MHEIKRTLIEFVLVGLVGLCVGLTANAFNTNRLDLSRNYFSKRVSLPATKPATGSQASVETPGNHQAASVGEGEDSLADRISEHGLQLIAHQEVVRLFDAPSYEHGAYVFVDARKDEAYAEGHIPGAYQLYHYRAEQYIDELLPICLGAEKIVVYCTGGDCEDSELAANELLNQGIDPSMVFIYAGGIEQWQKSRMPIEQGDRLSGTIVGGQR